MNEETKNTKAQIVLLVINIFTLLFALWSVFQACQVEKKADEVFKKWERMR